MSTVTENILPEKVMLTVNAFCSAASISRSLFYAEVRAGRIKARKCRNRTLIPTSELQAWPNRLPATVGAHAT